MGLGNYGGALSGLIAGTTETWNTTIAIWGNRLAQQQYQYQQPQPYIAIAPASEPDRRGEHERWLDQRVNEMRVAL